MDLHSGATGAAVYFMIGVIMVAFLIVIHISNDDKKLITPSKCLLSAAALASFIVALAHITA